MATNKDIRLGIGIFSDLLVAGIGVAGSGSTHQTATSITGGVSSLANRLGTYFDPGSGPVSSALPDDNNSPSRNGQSVNQGLGSYFMPIIIGVVAIVGLIIAKVTKII
jgi:hypothetical protein